MKVHKSSHEEKGEQDAEGFYDYIYEYDIFEFAGDGETIFARSYADEPDEAHFLEYTVGGTRAVISPESFKGPLFRFAVEHLRSEGKRKLLYLSGSTGAYESIKA